MNCFAIFKIGHAESMDTAHFIHLVYAGKGAILSFFPDDPGAGFIPALISSFPGMRAGNNTRQDANQDYIDCGFDVWIHGM